LTLILILLLVSNAWGYTPPIGIPDPALSFGSFGEIDQAPPTTGSGGARCTGWPSTTSEGVYYVDNSVSCNDTNCTNRGCPDAPRCTIPSLVSLAAGTYIEVHGGVSTPYSTPLRLSGVGTDSNPIWIIGIPDGENKPILDCSIEIPGSSSMTGDLALDYTVVSGFKMAETRQIIIAPNAADGYTQTVNHLIIRDISMEWSGTSMSKEATAINVGGVNSRSGSYVKNIVIYDNLIHGIGDPDTAYESCGVYVQTASNVWILDNTIYDTEEDNIAGCHGCSEGNEPRNIFVGGNTLSSPGADQIDFKHVHGAIISENTMTGTPYTSRCPGDGCGSGGYHYSGGVDHSDNIWTIFNTIHDHGLAWNAKDCIDCHFVGNVFYDATCQAGVECGPTNYYPHAVRTGGKGGKSYVVDNTIYGCYGGISGNLATGTELQVTGNLIVGRTSATAHEIVLDQVGTGVTVDYNMFKGGDSGNASSFYVGSTEYTYTNFKGLAAAPCEHCKDFVADSLTVGFTDEGNHIFTLTPSSSAIGANTESPAYDYFNTIWTTPETGLCAVYGTVCTGLSIHYDRAGKSRPIGGTWDIGAYEYDPATVRPVMSISTGAGLSIGSGAVMTLQ